MADPVEGLTEELLAVSWRAPSRSAVVYVTEAVAIAEAAVSAAVEAERARWEAAIDPFIDLALCNAPDVPIPWGDPIVQAVVALRRAIEQETEG